MANVAPDSISKELNDWILFMWSIMETVLSFKSDLLLLFVSPGSVSQADSEARFVLKDV